ncbi:MAG: hypothetical protein ABW252_03345 [Polyangiales bacterium]
MAALAALSSACAAPPEADSADPAPAAQNQKAEAEPLLGTTRAIAAMAGRFSTPASNQSRVRFYGTDLGWAFPHGDELWMLFGDSWSSAQGFPLSFDADDAMGKISLRDFPDGDAVERWVAAHPSPDPRAPWRAAAPPVELVVDSADRVAPLRPARNGHELWSGEWLVPVAGFSNQRRDAGRGAFGIFFRNEPMQCSLKGGCDGGFKCDNELGRCAPLSVTSAVCVVGGTTCRCVPASSGAGLCVDTGGSMYDPSTERGRTRGVVVNHQVGNALPDVPATFASRPWSTHRFFNLATRTAEDFDPWRPNGAGNDYALADGDGERAGVLIWGRPQFVGIGAKDQDAQLYFSWVPMPSFDGTGNFRWEPRHFTGVDAEGRPQFSLREGDGVPLDLDATVDGVQPREAHDFVGQMSVAWVPSIRRFVMLYGGDSPPSFLDLAFGEDASLVTWHPLGPIHVRFAEQPWGPWTPPRTVFVAGDVQRGTGQYGPGGILHHPRCTLPGCAPSEPVLLWAAGEPGRLYGASIIEPWTESRADGSVDLYWNLSTWNPYQVVLMKTHLTPSDFALHTGSPNSGARPR